MLNDYYEYTIATHFLSAIINDDRSGLTREERHQLDTFVDSLPEDAANGTWDYAGFAPTSPSFDRCEICGVYAECLDAKLWFHNASIALKV
jgi:hypothetical protein